MRPRTTYAATLFGLILMSVVPAAAGPETQSFIDSSETRIRRLARQQDYGNAMAEIDQLQTRLVDLYPSPELRGNTYVDQRNNVVVVNTFPGWEMKVGGDVGMNLGRHFSLLLTLTNPKPYLNERLVLMRVDLSQMLETVGGGGGDIATQENLRIFAQIMAASMGQLQERGLEMVNDRLVYFGEVGSMTGERMLLALHQPRDVMFVCVLATTPERIAANQALLLNLFRQLRVDARRDNQQTIAALKAQYGGLPEPERSFALMRALADAGEYDAAARALNDLKNYLSRSILAPEIKGNTYYNYQYRFRLPNPSPNLKFEIVPNPSGTPMVVLQERYAVAEQGILLLVFDLIKSYGREFLNTLATDQDQRNLLRDGGRGAAMKLGQITEEGFVDFRGGVAYQAHVSVTLPNTRVTLLAFRHRDAVIATLFLIDERNYAAKYQEYYRVLEGIDLTLESPPLLETALAFQDVMKLLEAGVTPLRCETIIKERGVNFPLTAEAETQLRGVGATDTLLLAISRAKR